MFSEFELADKLRRTLRPNSYFGIFKLVFAATQNHSKNKEIFWEKKITIDSLNYPLLSILNIPKSEFGRSVWRNLSANSNSEKR
jgi:hypothetical protein